MSENPAPSTEDLANVARVNTLDARQMVDHGEAVLVDTRPRDQFEGMHAEGAILAALADIESGAALARLQAIPAGQKLITYCT